MPVVSTAKMTARQYLMLGEDPPGVRLELVDGEIAVSPSPRPRHSRVDRRLTQILLNHIVEHDLGELLGDTDTVFSAYDVRRPDLLYFTKDREHLIDGDDAIRAVPDLCVEIVSPGSETIDRVDKFDQYAKAKVPYYWIVDPRPRTIEGFKLKGRKYISTGGGREDDVVRLPPFDGLDIPLGQIWLPARGRRSS